MTIKERIVKQLDGMDEAELAVLEEQIKRAKRQSETEEEKQARIERQLKAFRGIVGLLSDPEEYAEFEKHARRRPLFGGRTLDLEPDEEVC